MDAMGDVNADVAVNGNNVIPNIKPITKVSKESALRTQESKVAEKFATGESVQQASLEAPTLSEGRLRSLEKARSVRKANALIKREQKRKNSIRDAKILSAAAEKRANDVNRAMTADVNAETVQEKVQKNNAQQVQKRAPMLPTTLKQKPVVFPGSESFRRPVGLKLGPQLNQRDTNSVVFPDGGSFNSSSNEEDKGFAKYLKSGGIKF